MGRDVFIFRPPVGASPDELPDEEDLQELQGLVAEPDWPTLRSSGR